VFENKPSGNPAFKARITIHGMVDQNRQKWKERERERERLFGRFLESQRDNKAKLLASRVTRLGELWTLGVCLHWAKFWKLHKGPKYSLLLL
jgi:hypothetical protein